MDLRQYRQGIGIAEAAEIRESMGAFWSWPTVPGWGKDLLASASVIIAGLPPHVSSRRDPRAAALTARILTIDARMWRHSGIGTYLRQLLPRLLPRLEGFRFRVLIPGAYAEELPSAPGLEIHLLDLPIYHPLEPFLLSRHLHPDSSLVFSPHINVPFCRTPLLVTVHDLILLDNLGMRLRDLLKRAFAARLISLAVNRSQRIIAVSEYTRKAILGRYQVNPDKISVIRHGVDPDWFATPVSAPPRPEKPFMLYVGNFKAHKNLGRLLEAFEILRRDRPGLALKLVGGQGRADRQDQKAICRARQLAPQVEILPSVDHGQLKNLYCQASLLVLPSLAEGFGFPPLEAMASGCPCALASSGPLPEIFGKAALFFNPLSPPEMAAVIARLLGDNALRADLASRGLAHARGFSWERAAEDTAAIIRELAVA